MFEINNYAIPQTQASSLLRQNMLIEPTKLRTVFIYQLHTRAEKNFISDKYPEIGNGFILYISRVKVITFVTLSLEETSVQTNYGISAGYKKYSYTIRWPYYAGDLILSYDSTSLNFTELN